MLKRVPRTRNKGDNYGIQSLQYISYASILTLVATGCGNKIEAVESLQEVASHAHSNCHWKWPRPCCCCGVDEESAHETIFLVASTSQF